MAKFENAIGYVMSNEGTWSDHPNDPGGPTFWGISLRFLEAQGEYGDIDKDGDVDEDDVRALTRTDAIVIYAQKFWRPMKLDLIKSEAVAQRLLDMAVNMGITRGVKIAQKAYNSLLDGGDSEDEKKLKVDGKLGPKTRAALDSKEPDVMMAALREFHEKFYRALVKRNPAMKVFLDGWLNRARK